MFRFKYSLVCFILTLCLSVFTNFDFEKFFFNSISECKDKLPNCFAFKKDSCQAPYEKWAQDNCPNYCGFCVGKSIIIETNKNINNVTKYTNFCYGIRSWFTREALFSSKTALTELGEKIIMLLKTNWYC